MKKNYLILKRNEHDIFLLEERKDAPPKFVARGSSGLELLEQFLIKNDNSVESSEYFGDYFTNLLLNINKEEKNGE